MTINRNVSIRFWERVAKSWADVFQTAEENKEYKVEGLIDDFLSTEPIIKSPLDAIDDMEDLDWDE